MLSKIERPRRVDLSFLNIYDADGDVEMIDAPHQAQIDIAWRVNNLAFLDAY